MPRKYTRERDDSQIDITPMLDIVFIMLIFFIVTTSFVKDTGLDPVRPQALTAEHKSRGNILVAISDSGKIWMHTRLVDLATVRTLAEATVAEAPESSAVIVADQGAPIGVVMDVMDQMRQAGVGNVSLGAERID